MLDGWKPIEEITKEEKENATQMLLGNAITEEMWVVKKEDWKDSRVMSRATHYLRPIPSLPTSGLHNLPILLARAKEIMSRVKSEYDPDKTEMLWNKLPSAERESYEVLARSELIEQSKE